MLRVMSFRTTESSLRMLGPLLPSAGNGPAVSSGISAPGAAVVGVDVAAVVLGAAVALDPTVLGAAVVAEPAVVAGGAVLSGTGDVVVASLLKPHAASRPVKLTPPSQASMSRRSTSLGKS